MTAKRPGLEPRLPVELNRFVGRRAELRQLRALMSCRQLVTVTGVGGVGKTRIALRLAAQLGPSFGERVWLVELAPIADPRLVVHAVAAALGLREAPNAQLMSAIIGDLRERPALLVVDNCEHLVDAAASVISSLMQACPQLVILATSREPLRCDGESVLTIPPLSLPARSASLADVLRSEAVQLLVDRAAHGAGLSVDESSAAAVTVICRRLDGLPLALELAAGVLRAASPEQLAARLDRSLRVLRAGARTGPVRHESLRATIDWSYQLLTSAEQRVFERLSVFAGGASLEAVEAVCADSELESSDVLPILAALIDKSLIVPEAMANGAVRYRQLETLREYARARLVEHGDESVSLSRHADFFAALARFATPGTHRAFRTPELERVAVDVDNVRAALQYLDVIHDERILQFTADLWIFWFVHGHYREGATWLERALDVHTNGSSVARGAAMYSLAAVIWPLGEVDRAQSLLEDSLKLARAAHDDWHEAICLRNLSAMALVQGQIAEAVPLAERSLALARTTGDRWLLRGARHILANVVELSGDQVRAETLYLEGVEDARAADDDWFLTYSLSGLASLCTQRGELPRAEALTRECMATAWRLGDRRLCGRLLLDMAVIAARTHRAERGARLLGAGDAQYDRLGVSPERPPASWNELRVQTSTGSLALQREQGRRLALEAAIDEALSDDQQWNRGHGEPTDTPLTARELEIAELVAQGLSNLQIAQRLVITEGTTQNHLSHILDKLGLNSRTQVAAWVLGQHSVGQPER